MACALNAHHGCLALLYGTQDNTIKWPVDCSGATVECKHLPFKAGTVTVLCVAVLPVIMQLLESILA